jgi:hypothetical protein
MDRAQYLMRFIALGKAEKTCLTCGAKLTTAILLTGRPQTVCDACLHGAKSKSSRFHAAVGSVQEGRDPEVRRVPVGKGKTKLERGQPKEPSKPRNHAQHLQEKKWAERSGSVRSRKLTQEERERLGMQPDSPSKAGSAPGGHVEEGTAPDG